MEIWKNINLEYFNDRYLVSNYGRVKIINGKILNQSYDSKGYLKVSLYKNKIRKCIKVHRLVALTFIENPDNKSQVNHKDGNKENNNVSNLEWTTCKENIEHAYKNNLAKKGIDRHSSKHLILKDKNDNIISQYSNIETFCEIVNMGAGHNFLERLQKHGVNINYIDHINPNLPLDKKINHFYVKGYYKPIAIYDNNMKILAMYSNINLMVKYTNICEAIGNKANIENPIRYKKRGEKYNNIYFIKKLSYEEFFITKCKIIDDYLKIK